MRARPAGEPAEHVGSVRGPSRSCGASQGRAHAHPIDCRSIAPARGDLNGTGVIPAHDLRSSRPRPRRESVTSGTARKAHVGQPEQVMGPPVAVPHDHGMQIPTRTAAPVRTRPPGPRLVAVTGSAVVGAAWLGVAGAVAWLVFATPLLARLLDLGAGGPVAPIMGAAALAIALTAPAAFAIVGIARLGGAVAHARAARGLLTPVARRASQLPAGCTVISRIRLPDGRRLPEVVIGPHGIALFESLPPDAASRRLGERWEVHFSDGTWRPIENPLHRAVRDADRLRRHLEAQERDFVVRVQVAVLGDPGSVGRVDGCSVVAPDDVPAWLAALPAQRGLSPDRLDHLRELLADLA